MKNQLAAAYKSIKTNCPTAIVKIGTVGIWVNTAELSELAFIKSNFPRVNTIKGNTYTVNF